MLLSHQLWDQPKDVLRSFAKLNGRELVNPLNAHGAKAKLTWQRVSCKQNQSDKILSMTGEADSKFVVYNHWQ